MAYPRSGFKAIQNLSGGLPTLQWYKVSAAADKAYFIGDPVRMNATGRVTNFGASTTIANMPVGVIQAVRTSAGAGVVGGGPGKPVVFSQPTNGNFLTTTTPGWVGVSTDKDQVYAVQVDTTASAAMIGMTFRASAGAPNTRIGKSGYSLAGASQGTAADHPFKCVGLVDDGTGPLSEKGANAGLKVVLNSTLFTHTTGI